MSTQAGWHIADVNDIPPVKPDWPATWKSVRHHFGITAFGINAVTKDADNVLIPEHDERESGQQEIYFVHRGSVRVTLDGETHEAAGGRDDRGRAERVAQDRVDLVADHADRRRRHAGQGVRGRRVGALDQRHGDAGLADRLKP